ncbi:MAG: protein interacting with poly(A)-binding protein [Amphiamblys sp. WSBS2006]|nr:MAG: protein interacting with poly(A)-binding protein [Amphiamblys sp. WSBS2006]
MEKETAPIFKTDCELAAKNRSNISLEKWHGSSSAENIPLETGKEKEWDQFEANKSMFDITLEFPEEEYTTRINRECDEYRKEEKKLEEIAEEIEKTRRRHGAAVSGDEEVFY